MPKVRVKSLRSLASKMNPSILTGAITESADYIEELELKIECYEKAVQLALMTLENNNLMNDDYKKIHSILDGDTTTI